MLAIVGSICLLVVSGVLVLLILRVKELIVHLEKMMDEFKESIDQSLDDVNSMSKDLSKKLEKTDGIFKIIEEVSKTILVPTKILGKTVRSSAINVAALTEGIKDGAKKFLKEEQGKMKKH